MIARAEGLPSACLLRSSWNHNRNALVSSPDWRLGDLAIIFRKKFGRDVSVSPGEFAGVGAYDCGGEFFNPVTTQGEPIKG